MKNRLFVIAGITVLLLFVLALVALNSMRSTQQSTQQSTTTMQTTTPAPGVNNRTSTSVTIENVTNGQLIGADLLYIDAITNEAVQHNLTTGQEARTPLFEQLGYLTFWSPTKEALLTSPPNASSWLAVQLANQTTTSLHDGVFAPTWSPKGDRIAYVFTDNELANPRLTIAQPDGSDWETVLPLDNLQSPYERMWWSPQEQYIIALDNIGTSPSYVRILLSSKRVETLIGGSGGLAWSPSGKYALLQGGIPTREQDNATLIAADVTTGVIATLPFVAKVEQCAWQDESAIICITPSKGTATRVSRDSGILNSFTVNTELTEQSSVLGIIDNQLVILTAGTVSLQPIQTNA